MNKKILALVVILLLAGAAAIAVMNSKNKGKEAKGDGDNKTGAARIVPGSGAVDGTAPAQRTERSAAEVKDAELADEYGSVRTKLSRQVAENVVSLLDDAVEMGEMMMQGGQGFGGGQAMAMGALRRTGIELNEEQQVKASELYKAYQQRQMEKTKAAVDGLRKNPTALMELFLAGDARAREEMSEEEFKAVQGDVAADLTDVMNPLDRNNFRGGSPMEDEEFQEGFEAILDETQLAQLDVAMAEREAAEAANPKPDGNISNIPSMELETLDEAVGSAKMMTSGFKQVLEGLGGLQGLQPQPEPEPQQGGGGE